MFVFHLNCFDTMISTILGQHIIFNRRMVHIILFTSKIKLFHLKLFFKHQMCSNYFQELALCLGRN